METYVNSELEIVALATANANNTSYPIDTGENGLPLDQTGASNGTTLST